MSLEQAIEKFFRERYYYCPHFPGRGASNTFFGGVAGLLRLAAYNPGSTSHEGFVSAFTLLQTQFREWKTLNGSLANLYLLSTYFENVMAAFEGEPDGNTKANAHRWVTELADAEQRVAEELPFQMQRPFLEHARGHWKLAASREIFGENARNPRFSFKLGVVDYKLFLVLEDAPLAQRRELLEEALEHARAATDPTRYTTPFNQPLDQEVIAKIAYALGIIKLKEGPVVLGQLGELVEIASRHKLQNEKWKGDNFGRVATAIGLGFLTGMVYHLGGYQVDARKSFDEGLKKLEKAVQLLGKEEERTNIRIADELFSDIAIVMAQLAKRWQQGYLVSVFSRVEKYDADFKRLVSLAGIDYQFKPRQTGKGSLHASA